MLQHPYTKNNGIVKDFCTSVMSKNSGTFHENPPGRLTVTKSFNVPSNGTFDIVLTENELLILGCDSLGSFQRTTYGDEMLNKIFFFFVYYRCDNWL